MKWRGRRSSSNIEDRRSSGGGRRMPVKSGGIGTIVLVLAALYFGVDPSVIMNQLSAPPSQAPSGGQLYKPSAAEQELAQFVSVVVADTEDVWNKQFQHMGRQYVEPTLVMFNGAVRSGCGNASSAMGPFYCPADQKMYIDLSFYRDLRERHDAPGDFAQAYVLAHEVGHHIQTLLGISKQVHAQRSKVSKIEGNKLSVMQELQADCLAGIWAHQLQQSKQVMERGDLEEALNAAMAIGDDRLQQQAQGRVVPESFTHGTSKQRVKWFKQGFESGDINSCDTFSTARL